MAVINFIDYEVINVSYKKNNAFQPSDDGISLENEISVSLDINDDQADLLLKVRVGSFKEDSPFSVETELIGHFEYNKDEDEKDHGFDSFLKVNGVAILYPYVRSLISNVINLSNEFPSYNLPTINVHRVLEEQEGKF